ncbi:MAG: hypothetical protein ACFFCW_37555 [Candidatus Hodarchaeota archaeon]
MTAEIAIMNKQAIAIAADSAVTLRQEDGQKIFTSAHKVFALSKYHPVGIMVYGSAELMGVPWETIIKTYRNTLGQTEFVTLGKYANHFINFLNNNNQLFPETEQKNHVEITIYSYFQYIRNGIFEKIKTVLAGQKELEEKKIKEITSQIIRSDYDLWKKADPLPSVPKGYAKSIVDKYQDIINKAKNEVFEKLPLTMPLSNKLTEIAVNLFMKFPRGRTRSGLSGIVVCGFGKKDIFPSLQPFSIDGIANDFVKCKKDKELRISFDNSAAIVPFAQSDMVETFMMGIDPNYDRAIQKDLYRLLLRYSEVIVDSIEKLNQTEKKDLKEKLKEISLEMFQQYHTQMGSYQREAYINPVLTVAAMLPKSELASMAEALVNLTSFKRKISMAEETVGGPVDVAVISKADGFIWIKRKHYFTPEWNPQFFANYYREEQNAKKD